MRQAGRYLPEYREIRAKAGSFLEFCYDPASTVEATLQPIRRFGFDAAILFSDILVIPDALGQTVSFESGEGPRLAPITDEKGVRDLKETIDLGRLAPVFETVARLKQDLPRDTPLIGFCGAPWTVASYMIAGRGTPDQAPARIFAYRHPALFQQMIDKLVAASIDYLGRQVDAGVDAIQIFDTWAGVLPAGEFERWCVKPIADDRRGRPPQASRRIKVIVFARGGGTEARRAEGRDRCRRARHRHRGRSALGGAHPACFHGAPGQSRSAGADRRRSGARCRGRPHPGRFPPQAAYLQSRAMAFCRKPR